MGRDGDDVVALEAVAAGQDQDRAWTTDPGQVVDQGEALGGRELVRARVALGIGPAVGTSQLAGLGHLPEHEERVAVELALRPRLAGIGPALPPVTSFDPCHRWTDRRRADGHQAPTRSAEAAVPQRAPADPDNVPMGMRE